MDKFDERRRALEHLIDRSFDGHIASFAEAVGLAPSYVSRLLYPQDKPGMKRLGEGTIEKIETALRIPGYFSPQPYPPQSGATEVREPGGPLFTGPESELLRCFRLADRKGKDALLAAARALAQHLALKATTCTGGEDMGKVCVRCGYERQADEAAPETECPQCGVIYSRVENGGPGSPTARSAQARVVRAKLRHQQAQSQADDGGFVAFKTMYSPVLLRVAFIAAVVLGVAGAILAVMGGQFLLGLGCLAWILVARLSLEAIAVMFRISDDLSAVRTLVSEQALDAAREAAKPLN